MLLPVTSRYKRPFFPSIPKGRFPLLFHCLYPSPDLFPKMLIKMPKSSLYDRTVGICVEQHNLDFWKILGPYDSYLSFPSG